jgi:outer membrane lipoprotein-sorting protein
MKKTVFFVAIFSILWSVSGFSASEKTAELTSAPQILKHIEKWTKNIASFSISFSSFYKKPDGKIDRVERRRVSFVKKHSLFSHFRYDLIHPEKTSIVISPEKYFKVSGLDKAVTDEVVFMKKPEVSEEGEVASPPVELKRADVVKPHNKARELFKEIEFTGASLPKEFRYRSVFNRARLEKDVIYKSKHCHVLSTKSSGAIGRFWVTKTNNNLLKYVIINEDKSREVVVVAKKKKMLGGLYIPIEVDKTLYNSSGGLSGFVKIKYYGYLVNRRIPPATFVK